jgi:hypothetical protein
MRVKFLAREREHRPIRGIKLFAPVALRGSRGSLSSLRESSRTSGVRSAWHRLIFQDLRQSSVRRLPGSRQKRLNFGKDADVLAVAVIEKLRTNRAVVHQSCRRVPTRDDHAQMAAEHPVTEIRHRLRIEIAKKLVACFAHRLFAAQFVELQDESGFFLFRHWRHLPCELRHLGLRCRV